MDILVVDDDRDILNLLRQCLESEGITVVCAASAEDALRKVAVKTFRLMITDLHMPGLDGLSLARQTSQIAQHMPVILATGDITRDLQGLTREPGVTAVLAKPYNPGQLFEAIQTLCPDLCFSMP